jgi:hypothetical protein
MISNDLSHRFAPNPQPYVPRYFEDAQPQPRVAENTIKELAITVERKTFFLSLNEDEWGQFMRIVESGGSSRKLNSVIVPMSGMSDFQKLLADMLKAHEETPEKPKAENLPPAKSGL